MLRKVRKLKSHEVVRLFEDTCVQLGETQRRVFISQKVCMNTSRRRHLCVDTWWLRWDTTWKIRCQVTYRHVFLFEN